MTHPHHHLNPAFNTPVRLAVMAACAAGATFTFSGLRELVDTSDSQLSKALTHLGDLGFIKTVHGQSERGRRFGATRAGTHAFRLHAHALHAITAHFPHEGIPGDDQE